MCVLTHPKNYFSIFPTLIKGSIIYADTLKLTRVVLSNWFSKGAIPYVKNYFRS